MNQGERYANQPLKRLKLKENRKNELDMKSNRKVRKTEGNH
jgi:hypothetical protein